MPRRDSVVGAARRIVESADPDKVDLALLLAELCAQAGHEFVLSNTLHKLRQIRKREVRPTD